MGLDKIIYYQTRPSQIF